jgi:hypothetical protein
MEQKLRDRLEQVKTKLRRGAEGAVAASGSSLESPPSSLPPGASSRLVAHGPVSQVRSSHTLLCLVSRALHSRVPSLSLVLRALLFPQSCRFWQRNLALSQEPCCDKREREREREKFIDNQIDD